MEYSPWPLLCSFSVLGMPVGLCFWFSGGSASLFLFGVGMTLLVSIFWFRDVIREATFQGYHTFFVVRGLKLGFVLFIVSELFLFFSFFWAFFHSSLAPVWGVWPPAGINPLSAFQVPLLNTAVLLLSGVSITWSHHSLVEGKKDGGLAATILLGVYFLFLQYGEYCEAPFTIADGVYGSCFFIATGFHGLHVLLGATFLGVCWFRAFFCHFSSGHHIGFLSAIWYWHFVDVIWLFLFCSIYWWGS